MDEKGELDWQKTFGSSGQDILRNVLLTNDGGFLLAGSSIDSLHDNDMDDVHDINNKDKLVDYDDVSQSPRYF